MSSLIARRRARAAILRGFDTALVLDYDFRLGAGNDIASASRRGLRYSSTPIITFTRGSSGTLFDADGILQTASSNVARFDHDPVTAAPLGLLLEEQRENTGLRSKQLGDAHWAQVRQAIDADARVGPDGNTTMEGLIASTDNNNHRTQRPSGGETLVASTVHTWAAVVAAGDKTWCYLVTEDTSPVAANTTYFNLSGVGSIGTTGANHTPRIKDLGGGLYRVSVAFTAVATPSGRQHVAAAEGDNDAVFIGDALTTDIYVIDTQFEVGAFPTSIIETTSAALTRSADVATIDLADVPGFSDVEGTFYVESLIEHQDLSTNQHILSVGPGFTEGHSLREDVFITRSGNATVISEAIAFSEGTVSKVAWGYVSGDWAGYRNGVQEFASASTDMPTGMTEIEIGSDLSKNFPLNGHIAHLAYWNRRLPDAELQRLTA